MKQKLLHLFEKNPDMKTPRARKRRSFLFRFLLSFCIVLMGVGVGSTLKRVWDDYHKTGTADVKDNSAEIEQQVLTGIRTKKLHDLSPEKPKEIVYKTIKKGAVPSDTIHQPTETNIQFTDMGYISEKPSLKKLLTSGQKAGSTFYVIVKITATGESKVTSKQAMEYARARLHMTVVIPCCIWARRIKSVIRPSSIRTARFCIKDIQYRAIHL